MKLEPFRAIIFDCDGVLVDSERLGLRSLQLALRDADLDLPLASLARFSGRSHGETLAILESESGLTLAAAGVAERMDEYYKELVGAEGLNPCPGIVNLLALLAQRAVPFTLASSGPRNKVSFSLQAAGLASSFSQYMCGDDVARAKPAPDLYLAAAALISMEPAACLAIEDAPNGIRSGLAAGMQVLAVTTSYQANMLTEATSIVDSLELFVDYMRELLPVAR